MKTHLSQSLAIAAWMAVQTAGASADQMTSGGFEVGFAGWDAGGNVNIQSAPPYNPTEGSKLAAFNSLNSGGTGWIPASYVFTPQSDTVTIAFSDVSLVTHSVDMVLDHVRLMQVLTLRLETWSCSPRPRS